QIFPAPPANDRSLRTAIDPDQSQIESSEPKNAIQRIVTTFDLGRSQWTNIGFVAFASLGALFCGLYFFGGAEVLRSAAAWPTELFYHRRGMVAQQTKIQRLNSEQPAMQVS